MSHPTATAARSAMSLVEVVIASAILLVVLAGVMQSQVASSRYVAMAESQDELTTEAARVMDAIGRDLVASGWWFQDRAADYRSAALDRSLRYAPFAQLQDTGGAATTGGLGQAFKHTWRDAADPRSFPALPAALDPWLAGAPTDRTALFATGAVPTAAERRAWEASFFARSQELIFLKASIASWDHVNERMLASQDNEPSLYFSGTRGEWKQTEATEAAEEAKRARLRILYPSGWQPLTDSSGNISGYAARNVYAYNGGSTAGTNVGTTATVPYGVVMESGVMAAADDPLGDLSDITVNWMTIDGRANTTASQDPDNLREFMYAVVRSPVGLGRLVRASKVRESSPAAGRFGVEPGQLLPRAPAVGGDFYMQVERVLSDNVVRAVFDTVRTVDAGQASVSTVDFNYVRVRLYFARRSPVELDQTLSRVVDRAFAMRAQNSANDKDPQVSDSNAAVLGTGAIGIPY